MSNSSVDENLSEDYEQSQPSHSKQSVSKSNVISSQIPQEEEVYSEESSTISDDDMKEIEDIVRKKVQVESFRQQKKLDDLEANLESEEKMELKHNWRNKARSKLEILNQIKLGTDQTISILPSSLNEDEQILLSISKAQRFNTTLVEMRRQMNYKFKDQEQFKVSQRTALTENNFPSNHIPIILKNENQLIVVPPQNLLVRRGSIEQYIKLNLDNEPHLYQAEMEKRMGFSKIQKRKPYQKRKLAGL